MKNNSTLFNHYQIWWQCKPQWGYCIKKHKESQNHRQLTWVSWYPKQHYSISMIMSIKIMLGNLWNVVLLYKIFISNCNIWMILWLYLIAQYAIFRRLDKDMLLKKMKNEKWTISLLSYIWLIALVAIRSYLDPSMIFFLRRSPCV